MSVKESQDGAVLAKRFGLASRLDPAEAFFVKNKIRKLPYSFAKEKLVLPLEEKDGKIVVGVSHPFDLQTLEEIRCLLNREIIEVFCPKSGLEEAIERCYHQTEKETSEYISTLQGLMKGKEEEEEYDLLAQTSSSPVIRTLNMILIEAIQQGASDIHFEPLENGLVVRYRIDGVLQLRHTPPRELQAQILTRIKVLAKLDIAEHRLPASCSR